MKNEILLDAIGQVDDHLIRDALRDTASRKKRPWVKPAAIAACFCLILGGLLLSEKMSFSGPSNNPNDAYLSAEDVGRIFGAKNDNAASSYTNVYVPEGAALPLEPLPDDAYVNIYRISNLTEELSEAELQAAVAGVMPELTTALGVSADAFEKKEYDREDSLTISYQKGEMCILFEQRSGESSYGIGFSTNRVFLSNANKPLTLNGKTVQVDQRQSEAEILASLEWVRDALFAVFHCSFDSAEIRVEYGDAHEYGAESISVYYYNKADSFSCGGSFYYGDCISIYFDNVMHSSGDTASADVITDCSVSYQSFRRPVEDSFTVEATCKRLSLEEAEQLLVKGYVFGGHSCPICMAGQDRVLFEDYDAVGFEYVTNLYGDPARAVPFYAFYKRTGTSENGNIIYAKTYVCAVAVSGLEEYFGNQTGDHNSSGNP